MCFFEGKERKKRSENTVKVPLWEFFFFSFVNVVIFFNLNLQAQSQELRVPILRRRQSAVSFSIRNKRGNSLDDFWRWDKDAVCVSALDNQSRSDSFWRRHLTFTLWLIRFSDLILLLILSLQHLAVLTCSLLCFSFQPPFSRQSPDSSLLPKTTLCISALLNVFARKQYAAVLSPARCVICDITKCSLLECPPRKDQHVLRWNIHSFIFQSHFLSALRIAKLPFVFGWWYYCCRAPRATYVSGTLRSHSGTRLRAAPRVGGGVRGRRGNQVGHHSDFTRWPQKLQHRGLAGASARMSRLIRLTVTLGLVRSGLPHRLEAVID